MSIIIIINYRTSNNHSTFCTGNETPKIMRYNNTRCSDANLNIEIREEASDLSPHLFYHMFAFTAQFISRKHPVPFSFLKQKEHTSLKYFIMFLRTF